MKITAGAIFLLFSVVGTVAMAVIPSTELYPFPGYDLTAVRNKTKAESGPQCADIVAAWELYRVVRGSWEPNAPKVSEKSVAELDRLRAKLEAIPQPEWFTSALKGPESGQWNLAEKIGDSDFNAQKDTSEYQELKALAIVFLAEHELDHPEAARKAGDYLRVLTMTHPWDWEVHGLSAFLLIGARLNDSAWNEAKLSLFLNPGPTLDQMKFFAFVGSIVAKDKWLQIQVAIREASTDDTATERAILESDALYSESSKVTIVPLK